MSNYQTYFFIFSLWMLALSTPLQAQQLSSNEAHQEKLRASVFFEQKSTDKAITSYEKLIQSGYFSEKSLYELATLYEEKGNWLAAIYTLKKIQLHFGGKEISFRLAYLEDKIEAHVPISAPALTTIELTLFRQQQLLFWTSLAMLVLGFSAFFLSKKKIVISLGIFACCTAFLLGGYLSYQSFVQPQQAVLMEASSYYTEPSYAANRLNLPLEIGQTIEVLEQQDIWYRVSQGPFECWVPFFVVKKLAGNGQN